MNQGYSTYSSVLAVNPLPVDPSVQKVKLPSISMLLTNPDSPPLLSNVSHPALNKDKQENNTMEQTADIFLIAHQQEEQKKRQFQELSKDQEIRHYEEKRRRERLEEEENRARQQQQIKLEQDRHVLQVQMAQDQLQKPRYSATPRNYNTHLPVPPLCIPNDAYTHQQLSNHYQQQPSYPRTSLPATLPLQQYPSPYHQPSTHQEYPPYYYSSSYPHYQQTHPSDPNYNKSIHMSPRNNTLRYNRQKVNKPTLANRALDQQTMRFKSNKQQLYCQRCGITETPEWRKGPNGARTLCNACGLYHAKVLKKEGPAAAREIINNFRNFKRRPTVPVSKETVIETRKPHAPINVTVPSLHKLNSPSPSYLGNGTASGPGNPYFAKVVPQSQARYDVNSYTPIKSSSSNSPGKSQQNHIQSLQSIGNGQQQHRVLLPPQGSHMVNYNRSPLRTPF